MKTHFSLKEMQCLGRGKQWRTVASPGQAGIRSKKHKNNPGYVWSGRGLEQSVWRESSLKDKLLLSGSEARRD